MESKTQVFQFWVDLQKPGFDYGNGDHGRVGLVSQGHGFKPAHERVKSQWHNNNAYATLGFWGNWIVGFE